MVSAARLGLGRETLTAALCHGGDMRAIGPWARSSLGHAFQPGINQREMVLPVWR